MSEYEANEVRRELDRMKENSAVLSELGGDEVLEKKMREVVENGSMVTESDITIDVTLTLEDRMSGKRTQNVGAIFSMGIMLGAALERDVPIDSEEEDAWRDGEFTLEDD